MTLRTLADVGEFAFLSKLLPRLPLGPGTVVGPGQDCAVIRSRGRRLLFTIDALVEGVHFKAGWMSAEQIGRKSFLVNASDIAAMGGRPRFCVVNLGVPAAYPVRELFRLQAGIVAAARAGGAVVVGGNLSRAAQLSVTLALIGEAPRRIVTRQAARRGNRIYVTGTLGDAALGVAALRDSRRDRRAAYAIGRFRAPTPRLQVGRALVESGIVSAMIDVSDGLVQDLGHICHESGVGALIHCARLPLSAAYRAVLGADDRLALHGGEDYELLCTVPERRVDRLERMQAQLGCPITCIGVITAGRRVRVLDRSGKAVRLTSAGYDQFHSSS